jgi:hypothetical protein
MPIDKERMKRKKEGMQQKGGGGVLRAKPGKNVWRIFLFEHEVTKQESKDESSPFYGMEVGTITTEIDREAAKHFWPDGHGNCSGGRDCAACADAKALMNSKHKSDHRAGKMQLPRRMHHLNVVDMNDIESGIQLASLPRTAFEPILDHLLDDEDGGESAFGVNGTDFIITREPSKQPSEQYSVKVRDRGRSAKLPRELLDGVKDLYGLEELSPGYGMDGYVPDFPPHGADDDEEKTDSGDMVGKTVTIEDPKGKRLKGVVKSTEGNIAVVDVNGEEWEEEIGNLKIG